MNDQLFKVINQGVIFYVYLSKSLILTMKIWHINKLSITQQQINFKLRERIYIYLYCILAQCNNTICILYN